MPKIYLIAKTTACNKGMVQFLEDNGLDWDRTLYGAEGVVELAGRVCYMSFGKKQGRNSRDYIKNIIESGHGSIFEHLNYTFLVTGRSRGFTHEQVRHRAGWAYSQMSTRYIDYRLSDASGQSPDDQALGNWELSFRIPEEIVGDLREDVEKHITASRDLYTRIVDSLPNHTVKEQRGIARSVLPICAEAVLVMTGNARAIWNAMALRGNKHADSEIRDVYIGILEIMKQELPTVFRDVEVRDGQIYLPREKL